MGQLKVGVRILNGKDTGRIAGKLRAAGYYPVKLDRLKYLGYGVVHIKPSGLKKLT